MRWVYAAALPLILAACGQNDSGNVMAPGANALPPALVDLALGPETAAPSANEAAPANAISPGEPTEPSDPAPAPRPSNRVDSESIEEPADATAEEEVEGNNSVEE